MVYMVDLMNATAAAEVVVGIPGTFCTHAPPAVQPSVFLGTLSWTANCSVILVFPRSGRTRCGIEAPLSTGSSHA